MLMKADRFRNCPAVLKSYLRYMEVVLDHAENTLVCRRTDIRCFLQFMKRQRGGPELGSNIPMNEIWVEGMSAEDVADVSRKDIEDYLKYLSQERRVCQSTIYRRYIASLRKFYDYLLQNKEELGIRIETNPVQYTHIPTTTAATPSRVLSKYEITKVLKSIQGPVAVRDAAIILLIATTGLTVQEVVSIRYQDYRETELIVAGRKVPLTDNCQQAIEKYILEFRDPMGDYIKDNTLFLTPTHRKRLSTRGLQNALQKHFLRAGVDASARDLRQTAITEILKNARNDCERAYLAGCLGYANNSPISQLLPTAESQETISRLVQSSWLNDLGEELDRTGGASPCL